MSKDLISRPVQRRTILKAGLAIGAMQVASPFVVKALADETVKIGLDNPLTGTYAALGRNELIGAQLALDQIARSSCWSRIRPVPTPPPRCRKPTS
jgi:branched-chain amino acid transport system substrate-binding protein